MDTGFKFLLTRNGPAWDNPWGEALLSRLWWPWFFRRRAWSFCGQCLERFAIPMPVGTGDDVDALAVSLARAQQDAVKAVQTGDRADALDANSSCHELCARAGEMLVRRIEKAALGQTLTSGTDGSSGNRALGHVHNAVREDKTKADVVPARPTVRRFVDACFRLDGRRGEPPEAVFGDGRQLAADRARRDSLLRLSGMVSGYSGDCLLDDFGFRPGGSSCPAPRRRRRTRSYRWSGAGGAGPERPPGGGAGGRGGRGGVLRRGDAGPRPQGRGPGPLGRPQGREPRRSRPAPRRDPGIGVRRRAHGQALQAGAGSCSRPRSSPIQDLCPHRPQTAGRSERPSVSFAWPQREGLVRGAGSRDRHQPFPLFPQLVKSIETDIPAAVAHALPEVQGLGEPEHALPDYHRAAGTGCRPRRLAGEILALAGGLSVGPGRFPALFLTDPDPAPFLQSGSRLCPRASLIRAFR